MARRAKEIQCRVGARLGAAPMRVLVPKEAQRYD